MIYSGKTLEECLVKAEEELGILRSEFDFVVKKNRNKFFNKYCEIEVFKEEKQKDENENEEVKKEVEVIGGRVVLNIVDDRKLSLSYDEESIDVLLNGELCKNGDFVSANDEIITKTKGQPIDGRREIKIDTTSVEARITTIYDLVMVEEVNAELRGSTLKITVGLVEIKEIPVYTKDEILKILSDKKITYGLDLEAIEKATSKEGVTDIVVARGIAAIDDTPDKIKVYFESLKSNLGDDKEEKIDYKNATSITNVNMGEILGEMIIGESGKDGIDIYGKVIKRKLKKCLQLKVGTGCKIKENKVYSIIEGQPSIKSGVFHVHKVFETHDDVDIKSGNINFIGDVKIGKSVKDGMTVEAGNSIAVMRNVEAATIIAHGESIVKGSVINSNVTIGAEDIMNEKKLEDLKTFLKELELLLASVSEIKARHLFEDKNDGQLIKALLDSKFKQFTKKSMAVMNHTGEDNFDNIKNVIRTKLIGLGPLSIKFANDLYELKKWIEEEIETLGKNLSIPVDVHLSYVQDSEVAATGNVFIDGKGQYTSNIRALGDIIFEKDNAVSRGGEMYARGNVHAKILGSPAGISTIVKVSKESTITADIAYNNTVFYFGERKYVLEVPSKDLKAYVDDKGEIVVEKFVL